MWEGVGRGRGGRHIAVNREKIDNQAKIGMTKLIFRGEKCTAPNRDRITTTPEPIELCTDLCLNSNSNSNKIARPQVTYPPLQLNHHMSSLLRPLLVLVLHYTRQTCYPRSLLKDKVMCALTCW